VRYEESWERIALILLPGMLILKYCFEWRSYSINARKSIYQSFDRTFLSIEKQ